MNCKKISISECIEIIGGGTPKTSKKEYWGGEIPWLSVVDFNNDNRYVSKTEKTITQEGLNNCSSRLLGENDIILSARGTVGALAQLSKPMAFNQSCYGIRANELAINDYIYYLLKHSVSILKKNSYGSVFDTITRETFSRIEVLLPDLKTQKRISAVLGSLDNKIELNGKINQNLEAQAQAIFKSWFVDFEPFKNGKFVDSELGKIPEGWRVERLGAVCECVLGGTPSRSRKEYWEGNIPWINSGKTNEFRVISPSEFISADGLKKSATKLLPKKTTILAITGATLGQVSLLEIDACANQSVVGILENNLLPYEYIYMYVSHNIEKIISHQTGGAQQHINKDDIKNFHIILPPQCELKRYTNAVENLYSEITNLVFQSRRLSQLRDTLLPKLMSGEIDVSNVAV